MCSPRPETQPAQQPAAFRVGQHQARLLAEARLDGGPGLAQPVDQPLAQRAVAGPDPAVEQLAILAAQAIAPPPADMGNEPAQDLVLDALEQHQVLASLGPERVQQRLALAGGMNPPLDAQPPDRLGE